MQDCLELACTDCSDEFQSAALLLQHFAEHAVNSSNYKTIIEIKTVADKQTKIPNLYPIKKKDKNTKTDIDKGSDSGIEDISPLNICLVEMNGTIEQEQNKDKIVENKSNKDSAFTTGKKYQCMYCLKRFGWSTDLKRHILIHTGERPFHCKLCKSTFTRNFLLQKHQRKVHFLESIKVKLPELKPITEIFSKKSRKQHKCQIKRQVTHNDGHNTHFLTKLNSLLSSI